MNLLRHAPIVERIREHAHALALIDDAGEYSYEDLLSAAHRIAGGLLGGKDDLAEQRVAFMATPGFDYTAALLGIWCAGGIAVPLCVQHPAREIEYVLDDTQADHLLASAEYATRLQALHSAERCRFRTIDEALASEPRALPDVPIDRNAMVLYTSGTTSRPKGVVTTHRNISAQIESLIEAWGWS